MKPSRAEVASIFYVVILGQRRNHGRPSADLADSAQNDLRSTVIHLDVPANLDRPSRKVPHVAHILQIVGKDDYRKWAGHLVVAEIQKVNTFGSNFHPQNFPAHAFGLTHMLSRLLDGEAVGGREARDGK